MTSLFFWDLLRSLEISLTLQWSHSSIEDDWWWVFGSQNFKNKHPSSRILPGFGVLRSRFFSQSRPSVGCGWCLDRGGYFRAPHLSSSRSVRYPNHGNAVDTVPFCGALWSKRVLPELTPESGTRKVHDHRVQELPTHCRDSRCRADRWCHTKYIELYLLSYEIGKDTSTNHCSDTIGPEIEPSISYIRSKVHTKTDLKYWLCEFISHTKSSCKKEW